MALVLVADDDYDIRELVRMRLEAWGHEVLTVPDGQSALDALRDHQVDLVMLDRMMPHTTGLDVLQAVRAREAELLLPELSIVMMSARALAHDVAEAFTMGATDYLVKPFRLSTLVEVVGVLTLAAETAAARRSA